MRRTAIVLDTAFQCIIIYYLLKDITCYCYIVHLYWYNIDFVVILDAAVITFYWI